MVIRHNQKHLDELKVEKILDKKNPFKGRHNKEQLIQNVLKNIDANKRYKYKRGNKDGKPTLIVIDRYLTPLVESKYEFIFDNKGIKELDGYGALLIEKIIKMLGNERMPTPTNQMAHNLR